jgi:hypothetical protein
MRRAVMAVLGGLVLVGGSVQAHHSYSAFFDPQQRTVAIEGDLESLRYANPHVVMQIRTKDAILYNVTWQSAAWVERQAAVTRTTFKIGDRLMVIGAPALDPTVHEVTRVREVRRPRDGWKWRANTPFAPPSN